MDRHAERETIRRLRELASRPSPGARGSPEERAAAARQRLLAAAADLQLSRIMHRNPLKTVAIMAGIGFMVGYWPILARALVVGAASGATTMQTGRRRWRRCVAERARSGR
ncbi:MAG: hypothetical protein ABFD69_15025 [Candidatus Sumerlaeia bacterium]